MSINHHAVYACSGCAPFLLFGSIIPVSIMDSKRSTTRSSRGVSSGRSGEPSCRGFYPVFFLEQDCNILKKWWQTWSKFILRKKKIFRVVKDGYWISPNFDVWVPKGIHIWTKLMDNKMWRFHHQSLQKDVMDLRQFKLLSVFSSQRHHSQRHRRKPSQIYTDCVNQLDAK